LSEKQIFIISGLYLPDEKNVQKTDRTIAPPFQGNSRRGADDFLNGRQYTIATNAFACTGVIAAVTGAQVFSFLTFHKKPYSSVAVDSDGGC
jgi:hypothetical protein